jgi:hypothetical protein
MPVLTLFLSDHGVNLRHGWLKTVLLVLLVLGGHVLQLEQESELSRDAEVRDGQETNLS